MENYLVIDVRLEGITPPIWRRLLLPATATFAALHDAIQESFGWQDRHLWEFMGPGGGIAGPQSDPHGRTPAADAVPLQRLRMMPGGQCRYIYDFGDEWVHRVTFVEDAERPFRTALAVIGRERAGPPEDCGGPPGYARCVAVATGAVHDPELLEWLGGWQPELSPLLADRPQDAPTTPEATIAALFSEHVDDAEDLLMRLGAFHRGSIRKALAQHIVEQELAPHLHPRALQAVDELEGPGRQIGRLKRGMEHAPPPNKVLIVQILTAYAPEALSEITVDEQTAELAFRDTLFMLIVSTFWDGGERLSELLEDVGETRDSIITGIATFRRQLRIPAIVPYLDAISAPELEAEHPRLLSAILNDENGMITRLLDELEIDEELLEDADALAFIEPAPSTLPPPRATVSSCDGQGAFNVLVSLSEADPPLCVGLCIRAAGGFRDALISPEPDEIPHIQHHLAVNAGSRWVDISLAEAAGLVSEALSQHEEVLDLEHEIIAVAATLLHLDAPERMHTPPPSKTAPTPSAYAALLARPENRSWFLEPADLFAHNVPPPSQPDWRRHTKRRLGASEALHERYVGILRHSARFYHHDKQSGLASLCSAIAAGIEQKGLGESPLLGALLDATEERFAAAEETGEALGPDELLSFLAQFLPMLDE